MRLSSFKLEYDKLLKEVMVFLEYPKMIVSIHTHDADLFEPGSAHSDVMLYRPYTEHCDNEALLINEFQRRLQHQLESASLP